MESPSVRRRQKQYVTTLSIGKPLKLNEIQLALPVKMDDAHATMAEHLFEAELWLPRPRSEVFPFFSEARNLEELTPPWLNFEVLTPAPIVMKPGLLIDYRIKVHGIPIRWRTEILVWDPPHQFVDTQLTGPYTLWHHTHTFTERDSGTLCRDVVRYRPRGGALINWLFVRSDVEKIFAYRQKRLLELFGAGNGAK